MRLQGVPQVDLINISSYVQFGFICVVWFLVLIADTTVFTTRSKHQRPLHSAYSEKTPLLREANCTAKRYEGISDAATETDQVQVSQQ